MPTNLWTPCICTVPDEVKDSSNTQVVVELRDVGKTWARHGHETWAKQWFRPPHAHVFYLMISEKCLPLLPTSSYKELPM